MTLSALQIWRKTIPFFLSVVCVLPWTLVRPDAFSQVQIPSAIAILAFALVIAFFYVTLKLREPRWKRENKEYVGEQVKNALLDLIPADLDITPAERVQLAKSEVGKNLDGVLWRAIQQSDVLRAQKEHFYSNGLEYTSVIDVYLLCRFFGICHLAASLILGDLWPFVIGASEISVALIAWWLAIPRTRRAHLNLSAQQLELLRQEQREFVEERFRQIVLGWTDPRGLEPLSPRTCPPSREG